MTGMHRLDSPALLEVADAMAMSSRADSSRRPSYMPPCTMPYSALGLSA